VRAVLGRELHARTGGSSRIRSASRRGGCPNNRPGHVSESVAPFEHAKAADPLYAVSAMYLAWAYAQTGRKTEAVVEARRGR